MKWLFLLAVVPWIFVFATILQRLCVALIDNDYAYGSWLSFPLWMALFVPILLVGICGVVAAGAWLIFGIIP